MRPISFVVAGGDLSWLIRACLVESDAKLSPYPPSPSQTRTHRPAHSEAFTRICREVSELNLAFVQDDLARKVRGLAFSFFLSRVRSNFFFHKVLHSGFRCQTLPSAPSLPRTCLCVSYLDASALALNDFNIKRKWRTFNICIPTHGRPPRETLLEHLKGNNHEHIP